MDRVAAWAAARQLPVHMDGARMFNAAAALGVPPRELAARVQSVSFCLSKVDRAACALPCHVSDHISCRVCPVIFLVILWVWSHVLSCISCHISFYVLCHVFIPLICVMGCPLVPRSSVHPVGSVVASSFGIPIHSLCQQSCIPHSLIVPAVLYFLFIHCVSSLVIPIHSLRQQPCNSHSFFVPAVL